MDFIRKEETFLKWYREFGPIFSFYALGQTSVVLSDHELIRDAFSRSSTTNRMEFTSIEDISLTRYGVIFSSGELWQRSRRFTLHHLRNFGMGRSKLETVIQGQVSEFLEKVLAPSVGRPVNIDDSLKIAIANIIWGTVSGEQFSIQDKSALSVMDSFNEAADNMSTMVLLTLFPWLRRFPDCWIGLHQLKRIIDSPMATLFRPAIAEHSKTVKLDGEPRDYIDALLQEQARDPDVFTEQHLQRSILDIFVAGSDTTTSTLRWAFCLLASYPDIQQRLRQELLDQLGGSKPTLADRQKLPFAEAVLMEVQRLGNVAPYGVEHVASEDLQLGGYKLPRGTIIISLLQAVHMDPANFEDPHEFRPARFIDDEGRLKPSKALMPFSVGKRACLGESLARAELFLFVTWIIQKYRIRFPEGFHHDFSVIANKMLIREPKPFDLIIEEA